MREFWLKANDVIYNLNGGATDVQGGSIFDKALWFVNVSGLGYTKSTTYEPTNNGFYVNTKNVMSQISIAGDLVVKDSSLDLQIGTPYSNYQAFMKAIEGYPLNLIYSPTGAQYILDVDLVRVDKAELTAGMLRVPLEFRAKTPWYAIGSTFTTLTAVSSLVIKNTSQGSLPASINLKIEPTTNCTGLTIDFTKDNVSFGYCDLSTLPMPASSTLIYDTRPDVREATLDGVDVRQELDMTVRSFPVMTGVSKIAITIAGGLAKIAHTSYNYWRTV